MLDDTVPRSFREYSAFLRAMMMFNMIHIYCGLLSLSVLAHALPATDPNEDDFECLSSLHAHDAFLASREETFTTLYTSTQVFTVVDEDTDSPLPTITLCDGRPRVVGYYPTKTWLTTDTYDPPRKETRYVQYSGPSPTCTIAETACTPIWLSFTSALSTFSERLGPSPTDKPHCTTTPSYTPCSLNPDYCFIYAAYEKTLYYWPITTVSGDFCAQNGSTVFAEPTSPPQPDTVVTDGVTYTSPTNYLSWGSAAAYLHGRRPSRTLCGPPARTNIVVPITGSFYSVGYGDGNSYSFNFADLNTLPTSAYDRQRKCRFEGGCDTISGSYTPILPLPTEILDLEEEWKSVGCKGTADKYYVTPVALRTAAPTPTAK